MSEFRRNGLRLLTIAALAQGGTMLAAEPAFAGPDLALGEYLSAQCVTCHQLSGQAAGGVPAIAGLPETAFIAALEAYKSGQRDNSVMRNIAARLSPDEMAALAAYFAAQKH
jgi:cytochrome c553